MIIFIYGEDNYRSRQKLNEIVEQYKKIHKSGLNLNFIDCEQNNLSIEDLRDRMRQASMFKEKKLTIISNLFSNSVFKEKFLKTAEDFLNPNEIIVIYEGEDINKNDLLFKFLKKNSKSQEFKMLSGLQLKNWIKKEFRSGNIKIEPAVLDVLLSYVGNDLWRLSNEIKKLANFKKNKTVTASDVKLLVKPEIETDIFKTIDAIAQKNKKQALNLLHQHLEDGDSPSYLLSMINYQFRNLLIIKDLIEKNKPYGLILKKSGLHPFAVKKTYPQVHLFSLNELKKIYQKIFEVDLNIKTGKIEPELALELLIAQI